MGWSAATECWPRRTAVPFGRAGFRSICSGPSRSERTGVECRTRLFHRERHEFRDAYPGGLARNTPPTG